MGYPSKDLFTPAAGTVCPAPFTLESRMLGSGGYLTGGKAFLIGLLVSGLPAGGAAGYCVLSSS